MTSATELLPCPFCGGEAYVNDDPTGNGGRPHMSGNVGLGRLWSVECDECGADGGFWQEREIAIAAWNTRTPEQAIAATLGRPKCEYVIEDNMNESEGMGDVWFRCTNCGTCYDYQADDWLLKMSYCPRCGARLRKDNE